MSNELANLFAKKFIARPDVKAIQHSDGSWSPHTKTGKRDGERIPWNRTDLIHHIEGDRTFGHYLLNTDNRCKLFAFDVDLEKSGTLPLFEPKDEAPDEFAEVADLRAAWQDRSHVGRAHMKLDFKRMAHMLLRSIEEDLTIPCAAAYSGAKGIHVYAFTGLIPADEAREGAQIVLDTIGNFKAVRGDNFFKHEDFPNLSIEVFPKQGSLQGKDLGNLMRLPLGRNLKNPKDPTFFLDMNAPLGVFKPKDPVRALTVENPWTD